MTDEYYRIINRAIAHLDHRGNAELQDLREAARTALHHIFGREKKLREENERLSTGMNRFSVVVKQRDTLLAALRFLLKQVDEVERTSVVRESNVYRDARAAIAEVEGEPREHWANGHRWPCDGYYNTADRDSLVCECAAIAEVEGE